jgi:hypothetical protein
MNTTTINSTTSNTNTHNAGCSPCTPEAHQRAGGKSYAKLCHHIASGKVVLHNSHVYAAGMQAQRSAMAAKHAIDETSRGYMLDRNGNLFYPTYEELVGGFPAYRSAIADVLNLQKCFAI